MITLQTIGFVESKFTQKADPFEMKKHESRIVLKDEFKDGLFRIEEFSHILVIFGFHLSTGYDLKHSNYFNELKGVFAARSPRRPSPLGVTAVTLLEVKDNILRVKGLDALDGTPVYDIKPHHQDFASVNTENPRALINTLIKNENTDELLSLAGIMHSHFCPGLALGVKAAITAVNLLNKTTTDGMEKMMAITETNNCFSDGIQIITGCTFGNNALVYRDIGKTAFTLCLRGEDNGIRICVRPDFHDFLKQEFSDFSRLFDLVVKNRKGNPDDMKAFMQEAQKASFAVAGMNPETLFVIEKVTAALPSFAPIVDSIICPQCGESFMSTKAGPDGLCRSCGQDIISCIDGSGISI